MGFLFRKSKKEAVPLIATGKEVSTPYENGNNCLQMIVDNWDVQSIGRYDVFAKVLYESQKFDDPLHYLACAYACHYSKAEYRKKAIEYFEKYLENPIPCSVPEFNILQIYRDVAQDYEGEYDFKSAEKYYILAIQNNDMRYYSSATHQWDLLPEESMLGRLYLKISTQKALDYWQSLMKNDFYINGDPTLTGYRRSVDIEYKKALEKHEKGYVYRPRKK